MPINWDRLDESNQEEEIVVERAKKALSKHWHPPPAADPPIRNTSPERFVGLFLEGKTAGEIARTWGVEEDDVRAALCELGYLERRGDTFVKVRSTGRQPKATSRAIVTLEDRQEALEFTRTYEGAFPFMLDMKKAVLSESQRLTDGQVRAILRCRRREAASR